MSFKFSESSMRNMAGVNMNLVDVAVRALELTSVDFGIPRTGGVRTAEMQHQLYLDGKSQLDGYVKKSYHQTGNALDVFAYVDGKVSYKKHHLTAIAAAMLQAANELGVRLQWGGFWQSFVDMPHFEVTND